MNARNTIIVSLLVVAVGGVLMLKQRSQAPSECPAEAGPRTVSDRPAQPPAMAPVKHGAAALPTLLDLGAGTCIPCKTMAPILDEMQTTFTGQFDVVFIDVWKNEAAAATYEIRMIPTQIFFDAAGKEIFRHEGFFAREEMLAAWATLGYTFKEGP